MKTSIFNRKFLLFTNISILFFFTLLTAACGQRKQTETIAPNTQNSVSAQPNSSGVQHKIDPKNLPPPFATQSANNPPQVVSRPQGAELHVPDGFKIDLWAEGLNNPRWITVAPNGNLFVAESSANRITELRGTDESKAYTKSVFVSNLKQPFGIAFYPVGPNPKYIYIANTDEVIRYPYKNSDIRVTGPVEKLITLPGGGYNQHWTRTIAFSPDSKKLYIAVGSRSNVGEEKAPRAAIMEYNPDGTGGVLYASGLRNAVGLGFNPVSGALWVAVNERDGLGDELVPDYITSVKRGGFYGWPYYYIGKNHDPRMPERPDLLDKVTVPDVPLEAHSATLSISFNTGGMFPKEYENSGFSALHGSWNRRHRVGYSVIRIPMDKKGSATGGYEDFVWGWKIDDRKVWGRPVSTAFSKAGALLISDDGGNVIWRVTHK